MKVNNVSSTNFGAMARIKQANNKNHPYLYNEIMKLAKEYQIPATFRTKEIELTSVPINILRKLNKLKIRFSNK